MRVLVEEQTGWMQICFKWCAYFVCGFKRTNTQGWKQQVSNADNSIFNVMHNIRKDTDCKVHQRIQINQALSHLHTRREKKNVYAHTYARLYTYISHPYDRRSVCQLFFCYGEHFPKPKHQKYHMQMRYVACNNDF